MSTKGFIGSLALAPATATVPLVPRCGSCGLYRYCKSPKMPVFGEGNRKILIVAEGPGEKEDRTGIPLVGVSGQLTTDIFAKYEIDMDRDCWRTNAIICRATTDGKNRPPTDQEISYCRPNVVRAIRELSPETILLLGGSAVRSVIGWLWRDEVGPAGRWDGWRIPSQRLNAWVCPAMHPAYVLRAGGKLESSVRRLIFSKRLEAVSKLQGRPWPNSPNWTKDVRAVLDVDEAAAQVRSLMVANRPCAFDFETEGLKPDSKELEIYACGLCDGISAFAFPWHGAAKEAAVEFLKSDQPKIGFNVKFEIRWCLAKLGFAPRNWLWDGMLASHVLDNRTKINGLEFQAFVRLGQEPWDHSVGTLLTSPGSNQRNRIREAELPSLLRYCALDAKLEWELWNKMNPLLKQGGAKCSVSRET